LYAREEEFIKQGKARYNPDAKGKYHPYEIDYRNKNGDIFHSETVGTPVRNEKDEAIGLLAIVRDISDRKQAGRRCGRVSRNIAPFSRSQEMQLFLRLSKENLLTQTLLHWNSLGTQKKRY